MKIRQKLLLESLLRTKVLELTALEKEFGVSKKTLQNDFIELNNYLKNKGFKNVIDIKRGVVKTLKNDEVYEQIKNVIRISDFYTYKLSTSERVMMILAYLFLESNYITISYLCDKLYVSRSTINSDLIFVKQWCYKHEINLVLKTKNGIIIKENNDIKQKYLIKILKKMSTLNKNNESFYQDNDFYAQLFKGVDLTIIRSALVNAEKRFHFNFSDEIYHELVIQIASLLFLPFDDRIDDKNIYKTDLDYKIERKMARQIIKEINNNLSIKLSRKLEQKIAIYIKSAMFHLQSNQEDYYIQIIAQQLIQSVGNKININFKWDKDLFNMLVQHISGLIFRSKYDIFVQNPLKDKLIIEEKDLYYAINNSVEIITNITNKPISDDEKVYLLIYFASAKNKSISVRKNKIPKIIILCNTGQGTAQIVKNNLEKYFIFNIKEIIAAHQLSSIKAEDIDFIISTIPLISNIPYVQVNPMLKIRDVYNIYNLMFELGFNFPVYNIQANKGNQSNLAKLLSNILIDYSKVEDEKILLEKVYDLVKKYNINLKNTGDRQYMLSELLTEKNIKLNVEVNDWKEAVIASGEILENNKIIEHIYIEEAIKNVMDLGPYIVITKGVAIPHANSNMGVHKTAISLASLKNPVCFGNVNNDPVKYVFTLATVNATSHLKALQDLVNLLGQDDFFGVIDQAKSSGEIIKYIKTFENNKGED